MLENIPLFAEAGYFVIPLYLSSALTVAVTMEKIWLFASKFRLSSEVHSVLVRQMAEGSEAGWIALAGRGGLAQVIAEHWSNGIVDTELALARAIEGANKRVAVLSFVASAAPLLGLLGTVTGLIESFGVLALEGADPKALAAGINQALYTTALGLATALPALLAHRWCTATIDAIVNRIELLPWPHD